MPTVADKSQAPVFSEEIEDPINVLVYSPPGHGKTTLIGTLLEDPRLQPALVADFEGGIRSIRSKCQVITVAQIKNHKPIPGKITVVRIRKWDDFNELYDYLVENPDVYKSVAIDSLTEVHYLNLTEVVGIAFNADQKKHDPDVAEQRDYLKSIAQMRKLVRYFRDLDINVIFTATSQVGEEPRTRRPMAMPALIGKFAAEVPALVDTVGYLAVIEEGEGEKKVSTRVLLLQPSERFMAKTRTEGQPIETLENPTMGKLFDLLNGKKVLV